MQPECGPQGGSKESNEAGEHGHQECKVVVKPEAQVVAGPAAQRVLAMLSLLVQTKQRCSPHHLCKVPRSSNDSYPLAPGEIGGFVNQAIHRHRDACHGRFPGWKEGYGYIERTALVSRVRSPEGSKANERGGFPTRACSTRIPSVALPLGICDKSRMR